MTLSHWPWVIYNEHENQFLLCFVFPTLKKNIYILSYIDRAVNLNTAFFNQNIFSGCKKQVLSKSEPESSCESVRLPYTRPSSLKRSYKLICYIFRLVLSVLCFDYLSNTILLDSFS